MRRRTLILAMACKMNSTDLAKIADLKVISRTSVMQYKTEAKRICARLPSAGVAHIVEGSVQRAGERVRVSAQLIDARTDMHLWGSITTAIWRTSSPFRARLLRQSLINFGPKSPQPKRPRLTSAHHRLDSVDLYERAKALWRTSQIRSTLRRSCRRPFACSMKLSRVIRIS